MASLEVGQGAAPADVPRKHGLGRSGVTVRAHYGALPLECGWTWHWRTAGNRRDDEPAGSCLCPEERSPGQKSPRWSAERRARTEGRCRRQPTGRATDYKVAPFGAHRKANLRKSAGQTARARVDPIHDRDSYSATCRAAHLRVGSQQPLDTLSGYRPAGSSFQTLSLPA
jgi:hypothetical protein